MGHRIHIGKLSGLEDDEITAVEVKGHDQGRAKRRVGGDGESLEKLYEEKGKLWTLRSR